MSEHDKENISEVVEAERVKFTLAEIVKGLTKDALTEESLTDVLSVKENTIAVVRNAIISANLAKAVIINVAGMSGKILATKDAAFIKNMLDGLLESLQSAYRILQKQKLERVVAENHINVGTKTVTLLREKYNVICSSNRQAKNWIKRSGKYFKK